MSLLGPTAVSEGLRVLPGHNGGVELEIEIPMGVQDELIEPLTPTEIEHLIEVLQEAIS